MSSASRPTEPFEGTTDERGRKLSHSGETLYGILGIPKSSTQDEIRKAYRKLALQCHPDKNLGDPTAAERFKSVNRANSVLSDPNKRAIYDEYGSMGLMLIDHLGEENARIYMCLNHPCFKCCALFWFCATLCCCCCCCFCCFNFCCGKCAPKDEEEEEILGNTTPESDSSSPTRDTRTGTPEVVVTAQPVSSSNNSEKLPLFVVPEKTNSTNSS